ncbi:MAG: Na+/H+ antiporter subunit D [Gammaproteobacteria bacterium]|nr:Na+/H+ antiporter subunit D [Gammaproteobacteria bacterium]
MLILLPLLIPLATALLTALLYRQVMGRRVVSLFGAGCFLVCAILLLIDVERVGRLSVALGSWPLPYGIEFAADRLSAALVLISAVLGVAVLWHQTSAADPAPETPLLHPLIHGLLAAVSAAFLTADLFNLYVWFELMLIAALGLLVHGGEPRQLEAAFKYLALNMVGTLLFLAAVAFIYGATGQLNFTALSAAARRPELAAALPVYVTLLVLAFLLKAGAFPLFAWLPASYHTLPAPVLALFGGLLTKVGVYALLRLLGQVFDAAPDLLFEGLGWLALLTMLTGGLGAVYHWDLRRILAFHIVSQIGYLLLGIALASAAGAAATLFFTLHNILAKANLFLIAGLIWALAGHYDLRRIGGLYLARPGLALLFLVVAFSLVGAPPSSGFWSKFLLVRETFVQEHYVWGGVALAVSLLTLYSMVKIWLEAFWKPHPEGPDSVVSVANLAPAYAAALLLAVLTLAMGFMPEPWVRYVEAASYGFMDSQQAAL